MKSVTKKKTYDKIDVFAENDNKQKEVESASLLKEPKCSKGQSKMKKNVSKYKNIGIDINTTQKKKRKEKQLQYNKDIHNSDDNNDKSSINQLPGMFSVIIKLLFDKTSNINGTIIFTSFSLQFYKLVMLKVYSNNLKLLKIRCHFIHRLT